MTLEKAIQAISVCIEQMRSRYGERPVFDEWAIVSLSESKGRVLAYTGPRKDGFKQNFAADASGLQAGLHERDHNIGDFEFCRHGVGTGFESYLVIGKNTFLICNNTVHSMDAIAKDPLWLAAQVPFVELSEQFRADPLA